MMKILVTGASGLIGSTLCKYLTERGQDVEIFDRDAFSFNKKTRNMKALEKFDCIVHAGANTDVEICESEPANCYRDNTLLTEILANGASRGNCKFVYISSTGVYGNEKCDDPYTEFDAVKPTTHHHNSKWLGECAVRQYCSDFLILRAGWIFGGSPHNSKNFVARRIEEAISSAKNQIFSNYRQIGAPTFAGDFVSRLYEMVIADEVGVFNLVNERTASRFEYVSKIIELAGIDVEVLPISPDSFNRKANVPDNESAIALKLTQLGYPKLPEWPDSLKSYIDADLKIWINQLKNER